MTVGLLILRIAVGMLVASHGIQKLTHHLGGEGLAGSIKEFADDGFRGGVLTALAAGLTQVGAGLLLVVGLLTRVASVSDPRGGAVAPASGQETLLDQTGLLPRRASRVEAHAVVFDDRLEGREPLIDAHGVLSSEIAARQVTGPVIAVGGAPSMP
ncbi:MAG: putative oxidoreductase [Actinomycetota bacterium]|jgi:hypothetical protein|nr:putative oxidoreductase [Actinomycetota bacterium]